MSCWINGHQPSMVISLLVHSRRQTSSLPAAGFPDAVSIDSLNTCFT